MFMHGLTKRRKACVEAVGGVFVSVFTLFCFFHLRSFHVSLDSVVCSPVPFVTLTLVSFGGMADHRDKEIRRIKNMVIKQESQGWDREEKGRMTTDKISAYANFPLLISHCYCSKLGGVCAAAIVCGCVYLLCLGKIR